MGISHADQGFREARGQAGDPDLIIKGGTAITMVEGREPVEDARIVITDGYITDIQEAGDPMELESGRAEVIDARDGIILPGLVNAHVHAAMTLFRGFADDLPLRRWLYEKIFPAEEKFLTPETVYWGSLLGCLEMISAGTTTFVDGYFFQDETVRSVRLSGLRALIAQGVIDFPAPGVEDPRKNLEVARHFLEKWVGFSDLITPGIFCHSPLTCSGRTLRAARDLSMDFDLPLQIHLSETSDEVDEIMKRTGKKPVHYLAQLGLVYENLIAAHAVHVDEKEIECLREGGVKVVHVPESNMKLCAGVGRTSEMAGLGITVGLGTDGCASNNNLDLLQEMATAAKLSKVFSLDSVGLDAKAVLGMATRGGAAILGLEKEIGSLEKGKRADIIVVDLHNPHLCPVYDPISAIVYSAGGADVKDVVVDGRVLMKEREFKTLDPEEIMGRVRSIAGDIRAA